MKLAGYSPDELDRIQAARLADLLVVEADGAAGRSLKAHGDHEPVVSSRADVVVAVVGVDCIGRRLDDESVHRADLFAERLSMPRGARIEPLHVARIITHEQGYLAAVPESSRVVVLVSKVQASEDREAAASVARALRAMDRGARVSCIVAVGEGPAELL